MLSDRRLLLERSEDYLLERIERLKLNFPTFIRSRCNHRRSSEAIAREARSTIPMTNLASQLRAAASQPKAGGFSVEQKLVAKRRMLTSIGADLAESPVSLRTKYLIWVSQSFISRPVTIGVAGVVLAVSGLMTTVQAAQQSVPGDSLYTVKLINEQAQLQLASLDRKAVLHTEFASNRLNEVTKLQSDSSITNTDLVTKTMNAYTSEVASANKNLQELQVSGNTATIATASQVQQNLASLNSSITATVTATSSPEESAAVTSAQTTTQTVQDNSVAVAVQAHQDITTEQSTADLQAMFTSQFTAIGARKTFDLHRITMIRVALTANASVLGSLAIIAESDLSRLERSINIAVADVASSSDQFHSGDYRGAFDVLKRSSSLLRGIESTIADAETTITSALMNASPLPVTEPSDQDPALPLYQGGDGGGLNQTL